MKSQPTNPQGKRAQFSFKLLMCRNVANVYSQDSSDSSIYTFSHMFYIPSGIVLQEEKIGTGYTSIFRVNVKGIAHKFGYVSEVTMINQMKLIRHF